jgi:hypothetical protein
MQGPILDNQAYNSSRGDLSYIGHPQVLQFVLIKKISYRRRVGPVGAWGHNG